MSRTDPDLPRFERGLLVPVATYLVVIGVLSALVVRSPGASPPPVLGMALGVFLVAVAIVAFIVEGVPLRSILPSLRTLAPAIAILVGFWALYNLVAFGLALGGVVGFEAAWSSVASHPLGYPAALLGSLLFTALPEELLFRSYLQRKVTALVGGNTSRGVATGVALATGIAVAAVLFAAFHLPRWMFASGHGLGATLGVRFLGVALLGLTYGIVYAITENLWLVALFHATMNHPPFLVTVNVPAEFHLVVGLVEYTAIVSVAYLAMRVLEAASTAPS